MQSEQIVHTAILSHSINKRSVAATPSCVNTYKGVTGPGLNRQTHQFGPLGLQKTVSSLALKAWGEALG